MTSKIDKAFILAAGLGTRLQPYTLERPKPLVEINGKSLIDSALDHLQDIGVKEVVVNTHYMAEMLTSHLATRTKPNITISHEPALLDTGGGIQNALRHFNNEPFYCVSSDWLWTDNVAKTLQSMNDLWDSEVMDLLLLLQPLKNMTLTTATGDYDIAPDGRITRSLTQTGTHIWTSVRILHPRLFEHAPHEAFSFLKLMDQAEHQGRLYGVSADTYWHHISSAKDLEEVREAMGDAKRCA